MSTVGRRKQYVEVIASHHIDGSTQPQKIILADGTCFDIDIVKRICSPEVHRIGDTVIKYTVVIGPHETTLYNENSRWYVKMKESY